MFDRSDKEIPEGIDNLDKVGGPKPDKIDNSALLKGINLNAYHPI